MGVPQLFHKTRGSTTAAWTFAWKSALSSIPCWWHFLIKRSTVLLPIKHENANNMMMGYCSLAVNLAFVKLQITFLQYLGFICMAWLGIEKMISFPLKKMIGKWWLLKGTLAKNCTLFMLGLFSNLVQWDGRLTAKGCDNFPNVNNKKIMRLAFIIIIMTKRLVLLTFRRGEEIDWLLLLIEEKIAVVQLLNNCQSADDLTWQARHGKTSQKYFHFLNWRESSQYTKIIWLQYVAIKTLGKKNAAIKSENKIHQSWQKRGEIKQKEKGWKRIFIFTPYYNNTN